MGRPMPGQVGTMAGADAMRERIEARPWPRGGVEVVRANRGYTLYSRRTGGPGRACGLPARVMTCRSCGGAASGLPPLKWSSVKYVLTLEDEINGAETAYS